MVGLAKQVARFNQGIMDAEDRKAKQEREARAAELQQLQIAGLQQQQGYNTQMNPLRVEQAQLGLEDARGAVGHRQTMRPIQAESAQVGLESAQVGLENQQNQLQDYEANTPLRESQRSLNTSMAKDQERLYNAMREVSMGNQVTENNLKAVELGQKRMATIYHEAKLGRTRNAAGWVNDDFSNGIDNAVDTIIYQDESGKERMKVVDAEGNTVVDDEGDGWDFSLEEINQGLGGEGVADWKYNAETGEYYNAKAAKLQTVSAPGSGKANKKERAEAMKIATASVNTHFRSEMGFIGGDMAPQQRALALTLVETALNSGLANKDNIHEFTEKALDTVKGLESQEEISKVLNDENTSWYIPFESGPDSEMANAAEVVSKRRQEMLERFGKNMQSTPSDDSTGLQKTFNDQDIADFISQYPEYEGREDEVRQMSEKAGLIYGN